MIANSRQVRDEIIRLYGVDPARLRVIYNGLDRQRFHPLDPGAAAALRQRLGAPENGAVVLFVGSGFERKGLTYLLQAFGSLRDKTSHLWVVGKGHIPVYRRAAERLGVADRVKFWGPVTETAPFYQAATVLALPTLYDPCSNVVLEALACGTAGGHHRGQRGGGIHHPRGERRHCRAAGRRRRPQAGPGDVPYPGPGPAGAPGCGPGGGRTQLGEHGGPNPGGVGRGGVVGCAMRPFIMHRRDACATKFSKTFQDRAWQPDDTFNQLRSWLKADC